MASKTMSTIRVVVLVAAGWNVGCADEACDDGDCEALAWGETETETGTDADADTDTDDALELRSASSTSTGGGSSCTPGTFSYGGWQVVSEDTCYRSPCAGAESSLVNAAQAACNQALTMWTNNCSWVLSGPQGNQSYVRSPACVSLGVAQHASCVSNTSAIKAGKTRTRHERDVNICSAGGQWYWSHRAWKYTTSGSCSQC